MEASVTFSPAFTSPPDIEVVTGWSGDQMIAGGVTAQMLTGATALVKRSRGTLLLTSGPRDRPGWRLRHHQGDRKLMSVMVIKPAAARSLTTAAAARADLGLPDGSPADEQIGRWIAQASTTAASFCRRTFGRETVRERFEIDWRRCREDDEGLLLSRAPVVRILSVKVDGLTLAPSAYEVAEQPAHPVSLFYLRHLVNGEPRAWGGRGITVEYEAGWLLPGEDRGDPVTTTAPDLPADVERAVIQLVGASVSASGRDMMVKSEDVEGVGSFSYYVQGANASLPHPEAEAALAQYRRMAFA